MNNIVERIVEICREKNIPIAKLEKDLGYGNGYLNPKKVSDMKAGRLIEILDYIGISIEEFFNIGSAKTQTIQTALVQIKKASPEVYKDIMLKLANDKEQPDNNSSELRDELRNSYAFRVLCDAADGATEADMLEAAALVQRRKEERNRG